jgi:hypothetical protein
MPLARAGASGLASIETQIYGGISSGTAWTWPAWPWI